MKIKVLIDDDILIQLGEELKAEKAGEQLHCYFSIDEFLQSADKYDKETPIFVDSNLGTNTSGEVDSKRIFDKGFKNIILKTGYSDIDITSFPWIKKVEIK